MDRLVLWGACFLFPPGHPSFFLFKSYAMLNGCPSEDALIILMLELFHILTIIFLFPIYLLIPISPYLGPACQFPCLVNFPFGSGSRHVFIKHPLFILDCLRQWIWSGEWIRLRHASLALGPTTACSPQVHVLRWAATGRWWGWAVGCWGGERYRLGPSRLCHKQPSRSPLAVFVKREGWIPLLPKHVHFLPLSQHASLFERDEKWNHYSSMWNHTFPLKTHAKCTQICHWHVWSFHRFWITY